MDFALENSFVIKITFVFLAFEIVLKLEIYETKFPHPLPGANMPTL